MGGVFGKKEHQEEKQHLSQLFKQIKTWQLFLALIPLFFLTATFLRFDHLKMNDLKTKVLQADQGKTADGKEITSQEEIDHNLKTTLTELKKYTESHVVVNFIEKNGRNSLVFGTGPFYLENQYNRKATAALAEAENKLKNTGDTNPNGNVFANPTTDQITTSLTANIPSTSLYRYDFSSPVWAPDLAGFALLICLVLIIIILIRLLIFIVLRIAILFIK